MQARESEAQAGRRGRWYLVRTAFLERDGIVVAGVVPDDTPEYVVPGHCRITETVHPRGRLRIVITEVRDGGDAA